MPCVYSTLPGDTLIFADENLSFLQPGYTRPKSVPLGLGHEETRISRKADEGELTARVLRHLLNHFRVYHFYDTSPTARVHQYCHSGDNRRLMPGGGEPLAAFLLRLHEEYENIYQRIVRTVHLIAPFFADFDLESAGPDKREIILN